MKGKNTDVQNIKMSRFPMSVFWFVFGICLLVSGFHTGIIILFEKLNLSELIEVHVIIIYWAIAAYLIVIYLRFRIKKSLEEPLHKIMESTQAISKGDFSVRIQQTHKSDKIDYVDAMIENINKMVEELGSIETLKTDFISNVSHEMKTPIAAIKNSAQLLKVTDLSSKEAREYIDIIENASNRLSSLITNILKLNKLENQVIIPEFKKFDLCKNLTECILQFDSKLEEKDIDLDVDIEEKALVVGDAELLDLVWNNLLSNAIKFTDVGGSIKIRQWKEDNMIKVSIADDGCGMSEETLSHIYDKFYQGDTSHSAEGNGLGLALASRVLVLNNGKIDVESKKGSGTTFTVTLFSF